jgi:SAM-dependent methyltransferase
LTAPPTLRDRSDSRHDLSLWRGYLARFHAERAGITADVLAESCDGDVTPYDWLLAAVPAAGRVVDLACGDAPLWSALAGRSWVGTDLSPAELALARRRGAVALVRSDATAQPLRAGCASAVVCSMALMVVQPLSDALTEIKRVLVPGGILVALLPASGPLTVSDGLRYGRLLVRLRKTRLAYPNDNELAIPANPLARAGFMLVSDERRRFRYPVGIPGAGVMFVRSLYLPGAPPRRVRAAARTAERWAGKELGLPLRRIVARS